MEETKSVKSTANQSEGTASKSREADATSSETLSDLEKTQQIPEGSAGAASGTNDSGGGNSGSSPSPDGPSAGDRGGSADGSDSGGPM